MDRDSIAGHASAQHLPGVFHPAASLEGSSNKTVMGTRLAGSTNEALMHLGGRQYRESVSDDFEFVPSDELEESVKIVGKESGFPLSRRRQVLMSSPGFANSGSTCLPRTRSRPISLAMHFEKSPLQFCPRPPVFAPQFGQERSHQGLVQSDQEVGPCAVGDGSRVELRRILAISGKLAKLVCQLFLAK